jgi:excisionase family DNA binding protein
MPTPTPDDPQADRVRQLSDLAHDNEPPLTTHQLARIIGMSSTFIRSEIHTGELRAIKVGHGRRRVYRIPVQEALDYIARLGLGTPIPSRRIDG